MQKQLEGQVMQLKALYVEKQMELERFEKYSSKHNDNIDYKIKYC